MHFDFDGLGWYFEFQGLRMALLCKELGDGLFSVGFSWRHSFKVAGQLVEGQPSPVGFPSGVPSVIEWVRARSALISHWRGAAAISQRHRGLITASNGGGARAPRRVFYCLPARRYITRQL